MRSNIKLGQSKCLNPTYPYTCTKYNPTPLGNTFINGLKIKGIYFRYNFDKSEVGRCEEHIT